MAREGVDSMTKAERQELKASQREERREEIGARQAERAGVPVEDWLDMTKEERGEARRAASDHRKEEKRLAKEERAEERRAEKEERAEERRVEKEERAEERRVAKEKARELPYAGTVFEAASLPIVIMGSGGCAIAVDLRGVSALPSEMPRPHMTLLFSKRGFTEPERAEVERVRDEWLAGRGGIVTFTLEAWGPRSDRIAGELKEFAEFINQRFPETANDRLPHVELRQCKKKPEDERARRPPREVPALPYAGQTFEAAELPIEVIGAGGCAIAVDLRGANLPAEVPAPHLTLLFCRRGFTEEERLAVERARDEWLQQKHVGGPVTFSCAVSM